MKKILEKTRIIFLIILLLGAMVLALLRMMKIQIVEGKDLLLQSVNKSVGNQEIIAPRGEILDSNGDPLIQNKVGFNVIIEEAFFPNDLEEQNEVILKTATILKESNFAWVENIPVSVQKPYTFSENKDTQISKLKKDLRLNAYATPQNCIDKLIEMYKISDKYSDDDIRIIAGIRYEMLATQFAVGNRYTFAKDIPVEIVTKIKELSFTLQGVDVIEEPIRVYPDGTIFPQGIGSTGLIDADEYETLKEQGYKLNDIVGKSGIEKVMENELRGENGARDVELSSKKQVVSIEETKPTVPGNTVKLTIDKDFQSDVQNILGSTITKLNELNEKGKDATAGAAVVLDVKTGAVLAMATYPSYDMNDYLENYATVSQQANNPLVNRATNGLYRPGSTFKTITATAALNEGIIDINTKVTCNHDYPYLDVVMHCTGWHGAINVVTALEKSCNIFFYDVSQRVGVDRLVDYEQQFGLGTDLHFELGNSTGYLASPDTFANVINMDWTPGQLLQASIGQSEINISPLQMAVQAMTLANHGVRYRPYIVDSVWSYDRENLISKTQPVVEYTIPDKTGTAFDIVKDGMILASQATLWSPFTTDKMSESLTTLPYPVAIKTGTPQRGSGTDSAVIGYYPADNPEIAFSVFIEKGEYSKYAVRKIIDAYYGYDKVVQDEQISLPQ